MNAKPETRHYQHPRVTAWVLVLLLAFALRVTGVGWDDGTLAHADERGIAYIVEKIGNTFQLSNLNPLQDSDGTPTHYAYGHLLPFLFAMVSNIPAPSATLPQIICAGRILSALSSTLTVALVGKLALILYRDTQPAMLAAGLFSFAVISIQNAHFATTDTLLTAAVTASILFTLRYHRNGKISDGISAAVLAGLAFSIKPTGILVIVPLLLVPRGWKARIRICASTGLTMVAANPFMLLDASHFATNIWAQIAMVSGRAVPPFTVQFVAQSRGWYSLIHAGVWGVGAPVLVIGGFMFVTAWASNRIRRAAWPMLTWVTLGILIQVSSFAQFPRYTLPYIPAVCVVGAGITSMRPRLSRILSVTVLTLTAVQGIGFISIYNQPHPFSAATEWLYDHVQPGEVILVEAWDEPLPTSRAGSGSPIDAGIHQVSINHYVPGQQDFPTTELAGYLSRADWVVLSSSRGYGVLPQLAEDYPVSAAYYRALVNGNVGYQLVARFDRPFRLGPCILAENTGLNLPANISAHGCTIPLPQPDSSFANYDHPQVLIFQNEAHLSEPRILAELQQNTR